MTDENQVSFGGVHEGYNRLQSGYLFPVIGAKRKAFQKLMLIRQ